MKKDRFKLFRWARACLPFFLLVALASQFAGMPILTVVFFLLFAASTLTVTLWRCPQCDELFCTKLGWGNWPYIRHCVHCQFDMKGTDEPQPGRYR